MKWTPARNEQICSACDKDILKGEVYLSAPFVALCKKCGKKYKKGLLVYDRKIKAYKDVNDTYICSFCTRPAVATSKLGKPFCDEHVSDAIGKVE